VPTAEPSVDRARYSVYARERKKRPQCEGKGRHPAKVGEKRKKGRSHRHILYAGKGQELKREEEEMRCVHLLSALFPTQERENLGVPAKRLSHRESFVRECQRAEKLRGKGPTYVRLEKRGAAALSFGGRHRASSAQGRRGRKDNEQT